MNEVPNMMAGMSGWVCPKCGRVYSPYTSMCKYCGGEDNTRIINGRTTLSLAKLSNITKK